MINPAKLQPARLFEIVIIQCFLNDFGPTSTLFTNLMMDLICALDSSDLELALQLSGKLDQQFRAGQFALDNRDKAALHFQLGRAYLANDLIQQAYEEFLQCDPLLPSDDIPALVTFHLKYGVVRNRLHLHRLALESYSWLLELLEDNPTLVFKQGDVDLLRINLALAHLTSGLSMGKNYLSVIRNDLNLAIARLNAWIFSVAPHSIATDIPELLSVNDLPHHYFNTANMRESLYLQLYDQVIWQYSEYLMWENRFIGGNDSLAELAATNWELGRAAESLADTLPKIATAMPVQRAHFSQTPVMYQMIANGSMAMYERGSRSALKDAELALDWAESAAIQVPSGMLRPEFWSVQTRLHLELQMWQIVAAADANQSDFQSLTVELFLKMTALASKVQAILQSLPPQVEQSHIFADHTLLLGQMLYFMDDSHAQVMLEQAHALYAEEPPLGDILYKEYTEQWLAREAQKNAP